MARGIDEPPCSRADATLDSLPDHEDVPSLDGYVSPGDRDDAIATHYNEQHLHLSVDVRHDALARIERNHIDGEIIPKMRPRHPRQLRLGLGGKCPRIDDSHSGFASRLHTCLLSCLAVPLF
jgi:hypothetical protein